MARFHLPFSNALETTFQCLVLPVGNTFETC
jgi:hypothetical protein